MAYPELVSGFFLSKSRSHDDSEQVAKCGKDAYMVIMCNKIALIEAFDRQDDP